VHSRRPTRPRPMVRQCQGGLGGGYGDKGGSRRYVSVGFPQRVTGHRGGAVCAEHGGLGLVRSGSRLYLRLRICPDISVRYIFKIAIRSSD
jgi:hypothetical protein